MARKGWEDLSPRYRQRLEGRGVSRRQYESGQSLHAARGHVSARHESELRQERVIDQFVDYYRRYYSFVDEGTLKAELRAMSQSDRSEYMTAQKRAQDAYHHIGEKRAHRVWEQRLQYLPDYMQYYRGWFG